MILQPAIDVPFIIFYSAPTVTAYQACRHLNAIYLVLYKELFYLVLFTYSVNT